MGCNTSSLPIKYLGLPLDSMKLKKTDWNPVIHMVQTRLSMWQGSLLSVAGRLTLIKSTLASMPIYFMSLFVMPEQVRHSLETHIGRFLWNGKSAWRYMAKVPWQLICEPWENRGLAIKPLKLQNIGLLMNWIWKFKIANHNSI